MVMGNSKINTVVVSHLKVFQIELLTFLLLKIEVSNYMQCYSRISYLPFLFLSH